MTSSPSSKRARTTASFSTTSSSAPYKLHYWPTIPGRGEPIRLCFEATSTPYTDVTNDPSSKEGMSTLKSLISPSGTGSAPNNPPHFAPPVLEHGELFISQLPNILLYLGPRLGLAGPEDDDENAVYHVNQLALTALDGFLNVAHDTHHPLAIGDYYENQKEAAKARAKDYREDRLPKFLGYFERVLKSEASKGGEWLYGGQLSYADIVLFQCLDGVRFAFPKAIEQIKASKEFEGVWALYDRVKEVEGVKAYLQSERRLGYGNGIWRYYQELDAE
ncbi:MAG: hypothetical protein Q9181_005684 [Wetmoreana brouardii]